MTLPLYARKRRIDSPLGPMWLAATDAGLAGAWFHDQRDPPPAAALARWPDAPADPVLRDAAAWFEAFYRDPRTPWDGPLDLSHGTAFQTAVWAALCDIGSGQTTSYGDIARRIDRPRAVRAVGAAVGANPLSVVVPCHRVVGASGALTGYSGGLERKIALLEMESGAHRLL